MFNWDNFFDFAKKFQLSKDEAEQRTAISRAYYAMFHRSQDFCKSFNPARATFGKNGKDHGLTVAILKEFEIGDSKADCVRNAGRKLEVLHGKRIKADYEADFGSDLSREVEFSIKSAQEIQTLLNAYRP